MKVVYTDEALRDLDGILPFLGKKIESSSSRISQQVLEIC
jgi:hypothetical protein